MANPWWWDNGTQTFEPATVAVGAAEKAMAIAGEELVLNRSLQAAMARIEAKGRGTSTRGGEQPRQRPERDRGRRSRGRTGRGKEGALDEER